MQKYPKLKETRILVILHEELADKWLKILESNNDQKILEELIIEYPEEELKVPTVSKLSGKEYMGNVAEIGNPVD